MYLCIYICIHMFVYICKYKNIYIYTHTHIYIYYTCIHVHVCIYIYLYTCIYTFEQIELQAKLLNYFLGSTKSNINQYTYINLFIRSCIHTYSYISSFQQHRYRVCSALQCVVQCVAVRCSLLQHVTVCCSVLQCVAVWYSFSVPRVQAHIHMLSHTYTYLSYHTEILLAWTSRRWGTCAPGRLYVFEKIRRNSITLVCCSVCCSVLQCETVCIWEDATEFDHSSVLQCVAACVAVCCSVRLYIFEKT